MNSGGPMLIVFIILAVILIGVFVAFWRRDRGRSREVSDDSKRFDSDPGR